MNDTNETLLVFIPSLGGGGAERVAVTLSNYFAENGVTVFLVVIDGDGVLNKEVGPKVRLHILRATRSRFAVMELAKFIRQNRPTTVLSFLTQANIVACIVHLFLRPSFRLVISERNSLLQQNSKTFAQVIQRIAMIILYPQSDLVIAVSKELGNQLRRKVLFSSAKIRVIYNPIDLSYISQKAKEKVPLGREINQRLGRYPLLVAAGRLTTQKDYPTLLDALYLLAKKREMTLLILGEGPLLVPLKQRTWELGLDESVFFLGYVENPYPYFAMADCFVLSSKWEGLPGTLLQAIACGTKVVSTSCPTGPAEILENGKWGRLVPVGSPSLLAQAIEETLEKKVQTSPMVRARDFGTDRIMPQFADALFMR